MQREWQPDELVGSWTLVGEDWRLVGNPVELSDERWKDYSAAKQE